MASRRASSSLWRGIIVALGCISAVWLIFYNCEIIATQIKHYISHSDNLFKYFFNDKLSYFASLFIGISFFAIIIRDLWALKKPFLYICIIFSALCLSAVLISKIILPIIENAITVDSELLAYILLILRLIAYILFSVAGIRSKRYQPFVFYFGFFAFLSQLIFDAVTMSTLFDSFNFSFFIPYLTIFLANLFVFKCSLYEK